MSNLSLSDSFSIGKSHKFNTKNFPIIFYNIEILEIYWNGCGTCSLNKMKGKIHK